MKKGFHVWSPFFDCGHWGIVVDKFSSGKKYILLKPYLFEPIKRARYFDFIAPRDARLHCAQCDLQWWNLRNLIPNCHAKSITWTLFPQQRPYQSYRIGTILFHHF